MNKTIQLVIFLVIGLKLNAQETFYIRCVDADNLKSIDNFHIQTSSNKLEIKKLSSGIVQLSNFKRGLPITIITENYVDYNYTRPKKLEEKVSEYNGENILKLNDTLVIELVPLADVLTKRWIEEERMWSTSDTSNIIMEPDTPPSFVSEEEFSKFLKSKLHYPKHIAEQNVQGKVYIAAIVELDGSLTNIEIRKSLDVQLDRIALRAMRSAELPKIKPAVNNNMAVRSKIVIPVGFFLY